MIKIIDEYFDNGWYLEADEMNCITYFDEVVGGVNYEVRETEVYIHLIYIEREYRLMHIASDIIKMIQEENPGKDIRGVSEPTAVKFWSSVGATVFVDQADHYVPFTIKVNKEVR